MNKKDNNTGEDRVENIFTNESLPALFADSFRELDLKWNKVEGVNFEILGRVLSCHLIIEHYLTVFIELEISSRLNLDKLRLTFSQKLKLIEDNQALKEEGIIKGIEILNRIRNKFSHNLKVKIDEKDIEYLKKVVDKIYKKEGKEVDNKIYSDVAIIEIFTSMTCAFIAGYLTYSVQRLKELQKILDVINEKTGRTK
ncbi:hypothetical protein [Flavobacterium sp.]|uniref:hypothetical protein n=1 Tax=Flavobacterium sp. TaxID=239 RepID=UPI002612B63A|nr:hypothetical protein [Flavobacterium sp.]